MRRNQKKKKEKITKENKQTNSEIECTQVRGGFLGLGPGEYVQKPHKKNWGAKIEPAGCRQKLFFSGLCGLFVDLFYFIFLDKKNNIASPPSTTKNNNHNYMVFPYNIFFAIFLFFFCFSRFRLCPCENVFFFSFFFFCFVFLLVFFFFVCFW